MKKLSQPTGSVISSEGVNGDSDTQVVRPAILVHAGPEGQPIEFMSGDGPIKFDAARIKSVVDVHNAHLQKLAAEYGGLDKIPMGAYEPILDSHADDSNDRIIGRLTGPLKFEIRDVPKVGKNVPCAVADPGITFLGKETVERVKDGRIYHLSIGINEQDNSLGETSTVVQPAAPGAMLLSQGKKPNHGGVKIMSAQLKQMQNHSARLAKLSSMKETLTNLTKKAEGANQLVKLAEKKSKITHRLTALAQSGRIGRAEFKDLMDNKLTKLQAMDDSALEVALSILDGIQPDSNRKKLSAQVGSSSASEVMEMGRELAKRRDVSEVKQLRAEFSKTYTRMTGKKLAGSDDPDHDEHSHEMKHKMASGPVEERVSDVGKDPHSVPGQAGESELAKHMKALGHHLEAGDIEKAKESHAKAMKHMEGEMKHMSEYSGDVKSEDYKAHMAEVQKEMDEVKTNLARLAGMVQEMMGAEEEEGKHFGEISKEHGEVAGQA